ncbi:NAD(P)/FAD-dependent oxidoreductase [Sphaerisporangium perillae]|uniref:NAD(P)/FAD-dependent oxidoreductase n=1 Tax=Sphaerisporangium perillae TaxID=2935860 RepID=UPI002434DCBC|nr:NAD(P)/FAD-dependent oxidoreductase [Sphaerisporangium perillae]
MYDVIVVGARCAGSPAAMLLARAGYRVLLLDKARFPRDTLSTHYIHQPGVAKLGQWGVLDDVVATGCPPIDRIVYQVEDVRLEGCSWGVDGHRTAYAPRRHRLDPVLAAAATAAGAEFREGCQVEGLLFDGDRVAGVRCTTSNGRFEERARLVIGADGMRSTVASLTGAPTTVEDDRRSCVYFSYWEDLPATFEVYARPHRLVGTVPTNDGRTLVGAYFPQSEFDRIRGDAMTAYLESVRTTAPEVHERLRAARRAERLYGTGDQRNFFRQAAGPGWVLLGDSGYHKDSIGNSGITDAFLQVQMLVDHIGDGLRDEAGLDLALGRFGRDRDEHFLGLYHGTLKAAGLEIQPERVTMLRAIAGRQDLVDTYFATLSGACEIDDFYTDELFDALALV